MHEINFDFLIFALHKTNTLIFLHLDMHHSNNFQIHTCIVR